MNLDLQALKETAQEATQGPWRVSLFHAVEYDDGSSSHTAVFGTKPGRTMFVAHNVERRDATHIAAFDPPTVLTLITRVEDLEATIQRVRDLHKRTHAVFSWQGGIRYDDPCPTCDGKPGAPGEHECGCWADQQIEYVCAECHRLGALSSGIYDYTWPCPTIQTIEGDQT